MISIDELQVIAQARLEDAKVLLANGRVDGAGYVCGYAVELALKARISRTLNWSGFPEKRSEFENLVSFKTHKLDVLLALSGQEQRIKTDHLIEWTAVATWDPEVRYKSIGKAEVADVELMIRSAESLLGVL